VTNLNAFHHAIHQVTGGMSLKFNRAAADDLRQWAEALHSVADEMKAAAEVQPTKDEATQREERQ
jgi:hypothetical protein